MGHVRRAARSSPARAATAPGRPSSGVYSEVRRSVVLPEPLDREIAEKATEEGKSPNQVIVTILEKSLEKR
jgi:hypothetical protein